MTRVGLLRMKNPLDLSILSSPKKSPHDICLIDMSSVTSYKMGWGLCTRGYVMYHVLHVCSRMCAVRGRRSFAGHPVNYILELDVEYAGNEYDRFIDQF